MKRLVILSLIMFSANIMTMIFEIIGIRILAPYVGASIVTWSSLIVVILFFLSFGNYHGGKYADRGVNLCFFQNIFLLVAVFLFIEIQYKDFLLEASYLYTASIGYYVVGVSILLFGPISYLLGMIPPVVMKLSIDSLETTGNKVGWISGIGSLGAIFGTMFAGFVLIPYISTSTILWGLGLCSLILSLFSFVLRYKSLNSKSISLYCIITTISVFLYFWLKI